MTVTLTAEQREKAKAKAQDFLNQNIASMAMILNVNLEGLDSSYIIPVSESDPDYPAYVSLVKMISNLEALQA